MVGSTSFDSLIEQVDSDSVQSALREVGITEVVCQIGQGQYLPRWSHFRFSNTIVDEIAQADLVISHGGAGSTFDTLKQHKPLITVINDTLMHNHQLELVQTLADSGHLTMCNSPVELARTLQRYRFEQVPLPPSQAHKVSQLISDLVK